MLCCGLLALVAAAGLGLWRWLRRTPRGALMIGVGLLAAAGVAGWSAAASIRPGGAPVQGWMGVICGRALSIQGPPGEPGRHYHKQDQPPIDRQARSAA